MVAVVLYPNNVGDRSSIGLKNKDEHEQVSALLYAMGDCADDILAVARIDENKATYEEVRTTLNSYFDVPRNLIVQYKEPDLKKRHQLPGESEDAFVQDLYRLAEDGFIRDRIVVSVLEDTLPYRLQAKADLTLE